MNKTFLIFRHEFSHMVMRKSLVIMTLALPLLVLLAMGVYQIVSGIERPPEEEVRVGYVDELGGFEQSTSQGNIKLVPLDAQDTALRVLIQGDIKEYFVIPSNYISTGVISRYTLERQFETTAATTSVIRDFLLSNLLKTEASPEIIERVKNPLQLVTTRLDKTGQVAPEQGGYETFIIPYIFSILLIISIFTSSGYLLQGLGEEKENRVMEVLLSSVSARQLLTGKVLGLGAAGLLQIVVWVALAPVLLRMASASIGGFLSTIQIPANLLILGIAYFILGYLLFAVLSAGIGAISPTAREGQQISMIFSLVAVSPLWFSGLLMQFPNSSAWVALTIFPFTAPILVMVRIGSTGVPVWQLAISMALLVVFIGGGLLVAARVFRTYLLMYGKRPKFVEIMRTLRSG